LELLETARLYLRPTMRSDSKNLYHVHRDTAVSRLLCDVDRMTRHHSGCLLHRYVGHWKTFGCGFYLVFDKGEPATPPLGRCGLRMTPEQEVELGYCFTRAATGRGLATEAAAAVVDYTFQRMAIDQIVAFVRPENHASMRVLAKLGFYEVGPVEQGRSYLRFVLQRSAHRP